MTRASGGTESQKQPTGDCGPGKDVCFGGKVKVLEVSLMYDFVSTPRGGTTLLISGIRFPAQKCLESVYRVTKLCPTVGESGGSGKEAGEENCQTRWEAEANGC